MTAVIYARYSSDNQREESIEGQLRECKAFAEKNDIQIVGTYIDRAFSARTDIRKEKIHATDSGRSTEGGAGNRTDHIGQGEHQKPLSSLACCSILPSFHEARGTTQQL